ncbi:MAG: hypothetical protein HY791_18965 [Deltaproteobacteria bacterium]|nr:hypothetical protein [Deltaproteobacteria bacterium]
MLVRVLTGDHPKETQSAERAFLRHTKGGGVFVPDLVLAEISWVLTSAYGWSRAVTHRSMDRLIHTRGVSVADHERVSEIGPEATSRSRFP